MKTFILATITALAITGFGLYLLNKDSAESLNNLSQSARLSAIAKKINSMNTTWKAVDYKKWDNLEKKDIKFYLGSKAKSAEKKAYLQSKRKTFKLEGAEAPESFDSRDHWPNCESIKEIRDQSNCGSCWAVSSASAMSDRICIASGQTNQTRVSASDINSCCYECGDGCDGGEEDEAFRYWKSRGWVTGDEYGNNKWCRPYSFAMCAHHVKVENLPDCIGEFPTPKCEKTCVSESGRNYDEDKTYAKEWYTVSGEDDIANEISQNGPVVTGFTVYEDFMTYREGIYEHQTGSDLGGHAVRIIGYGEENGTKYWLVSNSWNNYWGEDGRFRILKGVNHCGFEEDVVAGIANVPGSVRSDDN